MFSSPLLTSVLLPSPFASCRNEGSGIGRAVLFLYKLPDETASNRRLAKQLVESWSQPIFDQYSETRHDDMRAEDERLQLRAARQQVCVATLGIVLLTGMAA